MSLAPLHRAFVAQHIVHCLAQPLGPFYHARETLPDFQPTLHKPAKERRTLGLIFRGRPNEAHERGETATNIHELGAFLFDQGRLKEAEIVLQEALTVRRNFRGLTHPEVVETQRLLARIH